MGYGVYFIEFQVLIAFCDDVFFSKNFHGADCLTGTGPAGTKGGADHDRHHPLHNDVDP